MQRACCLYHDKLLSADVFVPCGSLAPEQAMGSVDFSLTTLIQQIHYLVSKLLKLRHIPFTREHVETFPYNKSKYHIQSQSYDQFLVLLAQLHGHS